LKKSCRKYLNPHHYLFLAFILLIKPSLNSYSQKLDIDNSGFFYQIAPLYEFKQGVVSLTFDDGSRNQFDIGIPLLKKKGLPATFYLITGIIDSLTRSKLINEKSSEFEFGSHSDTHPDLTKIGNSGDKREFLESQTFLKTNFGVNSGLTMSYPWGKYNKSVMQVASEYFMAARTTDPGYNSFYFQDRYALKTRSFDHHTSAAQANVWVFNATQNGQWLIEMLHGINGIGYSPIDSGVLAEHLDYIVNAQDKVWCSTISNVIKYLDEAEHSVIECDNCCDTLFKIRIDDFLDDSIYNQQLSVRIKIPSAWDRISISDIDSFRTVISNKSKFIVFNTLPDNQFHTIRPLTLSTPEIENGIKIVYLSANPFMDNIRFSLEFFKKTDIEITLSNLNGQIFIQQMEKSVFGVINMYFNTAELSKGIFILKISSNFGEIITKKLVKV
jgi:peptidoglycan/xylan/chitin deacetylase (PgdA/CDA1 family)